MRVKEREVVCFGVRLGRLEKEGLRGTMRRLRMDGKDVDVWRRGRGRD
jgi:hypothetical protein